MKKYIIYITLLALVEIGLALYLTEWRNLFWTYVEARNYRGFCIQIGVFTAVASTFCLVSAFSGYFISLCSIKWREILNSRAILAVSDVDNLNQRVQEDSASYPDLMLNVIFGLGKAAVYIVVFSTALVLNFSWMYLTIITVYAIVSTIVAKIIAKPLISINYKTQVAEATYRNNLTELNFRQCISMMLQSAVSTKRLAYFQTFYGQIAVVLPIIVVAPAYFSAAITLGALMQATSTMGTISENMSYGITSFNIINRLISCRRRLIEIGVI